MATEWRKLIGSVDAWLEAVKILHTASSPDWLRSRFMKSFASVMEHGWKRMKANDFHAANLVFRAVTGTVKVQTDAEFATLLASSTTPLSRKRKVVDDDRLNEGEGDVVEAVDEHEDGEDGESKAEKMDKPQTVEAESKRLATPLRDGASKKKARKGLATKIGVQSSREELQAAKAKKVSDLKPEGAVSDAEVSQADEDEGEAGDEKEDDEEDEGRKSARLVLKDRSPKERPKAKRSKAKVKKRAEGVKGSVKPGKGKRATKKLGHLKKQLKKVATTDTADDSDQPVSRAMSQRLVKMIKAATKKPARGKAARVKTHKHDFVLIPRGEEDSWTCSICKEPAERLAIVEGVGAKLRRVQHGSALFRCGMTHASSSKSQLKKTLAVCQLRVCLVCYRTANAAAVPPRSPSPSVVEETPATTPIAAAVASSASASTSSSALASSASAAPKPGTPLLPFLASPPPTGPARCMSPLDLDSVAPAGREPTEADLNAKTSDSLVVHSASGGDAKRAESSDEDSGDENSSDEDSLTSLPKGESKRVAKITASGSDVARASVCAAAPTDQNAPALEPRPRDVIDPALLVDATSSLDASLAVLSQSPLPVVVGSAAIAVVVGSAAIAVVGSVAIADPPSAAPLSVASATKAPAKAIVSPAEAPVDVALVDPAPAAPAAASPDNSAGKSPSEPHPVAAHSVEFKGGKAEKADVAEEATMDTGEDEEEDKGDDDVDTAEKEGSQTSSTDDLINKKIDTSPSGVIAADHPSQLGRPCFHEWVAVTELSLLRWTCAVCKEPTKPGDDGVWQCVTSMVCKRSMCLACVHACGLKLFIDDDEHDTKSVPGKPGDLHRHLLRSPADCFHPAAKPFGKDSSLDPWTCAACEKTKKLPDLQHRCCRLVHGSICEAFGPFCGNCAGTVRS